jgi:hypothetical protein
MVTEPTSGNLPDQVYNDLFFLGQLSPTGKIDGEVPAVLDKTFPSP